MSTQSNMSFCWLLMILLLAAFFNLDRISGFDDDGQAKEEVNEDESSDDSTPRNFKKTAEELADEIIGRDKVQVKGDDASTSNLTLDFGTSPGYLLFNIPVQLELELSPEQREEMQQIRLKFAREVARAIQSARTGDETNKARDLDSSDLEKILADTRKRQEIELKEILLPFQKERLDQIALQTRMKFGGTSSALVSDVVAEQLELTSEQRDNIKLRAEDLRVEIAEKIKELQRLADNSLLEELTPAQRIKFEELTGVPFRLRELRPLPPLAKADEEKKVERRNPIQRTPNPINEEEREAD